MNTLIQVIFVVISVLILGSALITVTARNLMHAALWMIAGFFGIGALYLLMQAEFAAIVQVLIYVGAIAILILFAIMLTHDLEGEGGEPIFRRQWQALIIVAMLLGILLIPTVLTFDWNTYQPLPGATTKIAGAEQLGTAFMREFLLPFELASILLLVALVGAIVIGLDDTARKRILTLAEEFQLRRVQAQKIEPAAEEVDS